MDASPPLYAVVSLSPGLPPHELLLRCQTGCTRGPSGPEPQRGTGSSPPGGGKLKSLRLIVVLGEASS